MRVNGFLCMLTFVVVSLVFIEGFSSSTCSAVDFKKSNEGILWNYVDMYMYGQEEHEEYPGVPPYGPGKLTGGELFTTVPFSDDTIRVLAPLYYKPLPTSPNPKDYALFASYIMWAKDDMKIHGEAHMSIWVEVDATNLNPWDIAMSRFRFDILDNNDVVRGSVEVEVENYIDVIKEVEASFQIIDYDMKVDDYFTLQFWYSGIGEIYILYGSEQCPSRLSIPTDSVKMESEVSHDKDEGIISVSSIINNSFGIADIRNVQLMIYAPGESDPLFSKEINVSILENACLDGNTSLYYNWIQWSYLEDLDSGAIPEGNYIVQISVIDNSSNVWKSSHEVNLYRFVKVTTVILYVLGGTSILGAFGWVYRDVLKFGAFSFMFGLPLMAKSVDRDRTNQGKLLQVIHDNPGVWYEEVKRKSGVTNGTAVYHLRHLEKEGKIVSIRDKNKKRYFRRGESGLSEGRFITNTQQAIYSYIKTSGTMGMTPKQVGNLVGLSRRRVRDYLTNLVAKDFIEYRPDPRDKRIILYYAKGSKPSELTPEIREGIHEILGLTPSMDFKMLSERIKQLFNVTISENQIEEFLRVNYPSRWQNIKERHTIGYHG